MCERPETTEPVVVSGSCRTDTRHGDAACGLWGQDPCSPRRIPPLQLTAKWFAGPMRILGEWASNELPTRDCHGLR